MEICGVPVQLYRPDELLPHSAKLSANFVDEFTSARGLMASLRYGAIVERKGRRNNLDKLYIPIT